MARRSDPDSCSICGQHIDVIVRCFAYKPFYDGKRYSEVCFICASAIKTCHLLNPEEEDIKKLNWERYENEPGVGPIHLKTVDEMAEDGWAKAEDRKQAEISIKAIKTACRKRKVPLAK